MSPIIIVVLVIVGVLIIYNLINKLVQNVKEHRKIEQAKFLWTSACYEEFLSFVQWRQDLYMVVDEDTFFKTALTFPAEMFLSALIQYGFIKITRRENTRYGYSGIMKPGAFYEASASEKVQDMVKNRLAEYLHMRNLVDSLLLYFAAFAIVEDKSASVFADVINEVNRTELRITDIVVSDQLNRWQKLVGIKGDNNSSKFTDAELALFRITGRLSKDDFLKTSSLASGTFDEIILNRYTLRFYSDSHTYFVNGIRVQSVTQMLKEIDYSYANYDGVSKAVLNRAAAKGTALHSEIQTFEENGVYGSTQEFGNYLKLKERNRFTVDACERYVIIACDDVPVCAGRMDLLITTESNRRAIADIKRTSTYKKNDVTKQINLYRLGYIQMYGGSIEEAYCLRLREDVAQFRKVEVNEQLAKDLLERYVSWLRNYAQSYFELLVAIKKRS